MANLKDIFTVEPGTSQLNAAKKKIAEKLDYLQTSSKNIIEQLDLNWENFQNRLDSFFKDALKMSIKYDNNLQLGRSNFRKVLEDLNKTPEQQRPGNAQGNVHPTPYELAQLTLNVGTKKGRRESDDDYENKLNLPPGWKLLTSAMNGDFINEYRGAAFYNSEKKLVVVAHQGTRNFGSVVADLGILLKFKTSRMNSALTFADHVARALEDLPAVGLSFTGHSLGGWLAHISCFTAKYLKVHESEFIKHPSKGIHAHSVSFDNPGCRTMLIRLAKIYNLRKNSYKSLDITSYLSAPNIVNTYDYHVGTIYRIHQDISGIQIILDDSVNPHCVLIELLKETHPMKYIASAFSEETGNVASQNGQLRQEKVKQWPHITLRELNQKKASYFIQHHFSRSLPPSRPQ